MKNICIIPARGGSKRIPRKNIKEFLGMPIIAYSIKAAIESGVFDEVMVSTDDEEIAQVALQYGAKVPFMRSAESSNDFATTDDVLKEVIEQYMNIGLQFDNMCCIYATAPLINPNDIINAYQHLIKSDYTIVYPVVAFSYPIWRCLDLAKDGSIKYHWPEYEFSRSQDLPKEYHDTGTLYWHKIDKWMNGDRTAGGVKVDETTIQDIDTEIDWKIAEIKYKLMHGDM